MDIIAQLKNNKSFYGTCPSCDEEFRFARAVLFHLKKPLPAAAHEKLQALNQEIQDRRADIAKRKLLATTRAEVTTQSVNLGKIVETIAPSFSSFGFSPGDCRALFEPIDYLIFTGLSRRKTVDSLVFVDVKSGQSRLQQCQREIKRVVSNGGVELRQIRRMGRRAR